MTNKWQIVAGDYGGSYKATKKDLDLSACTAKVKIWRGSTILVDYLPEAGIVVTYDPDEDESYCYYDVQSGDIPTTAAIDDRMTIYKVMVRFLRGGYVEHDLGFEMQVFPSPPVAE